METRVQQVLDGVLPASELNAEERAQLRAAEALIHNVVHSVPVRPMPDLSAAVLSEIDAVAPRTERIGVVSRALSWVWRPRAFSLQLRPVYALALVALIATGVSIRSARPNNQVAAAPRVFVQFRLDAPNAEAVSLAGDFTKWQPAYKLTRTDAGVWTVIVPLNPGVHDYAFVVDGERWTPDPMAPAVQDGFGGLNSRMALLAPEQRSI